MSSEWNLIYATNSFGDAVAGDLGEFRNAVLAGADVKVLYSPDEDIWWSRNCSSVTVIGVGSGTHIAATFMEAADTSYSAGDGLDFDEPFSLEYHIYNTTGVRVNAKFEYQNQTLRGKRSKILPMKWYVKDYSLRPKWVQDGRDIGGILGEPVDNS
jgi:hypothetical protein